MPESSLKPSTPFGFQPPTADRLRITRVTQTAGALALFVVGGLHLEQYYVAFFSVVPTIGPLFLANFIGATVFGLVLLVPLRRGAGRVWLFLDSAVALAGLGLSVGAFAGLLVSEHTPLFGFMEHGYRLEVVLALVAEAVAATALTAFLVCIACWTPGLRREPVTEPEAATEHKGVTS